MFTKIVIKGYLKNFQENTEEHFQVPAIKTKNKLTFLKEKEKYIIKILSSKKLILVRENSEIISTMYFEQSKKKTTSYTLKSNDITLDIKVTTLALSITTNSIRIEYLIEETKTKYEYYIGWSD